MRAQWIAMAGLFTGCGSYWDLRGGEELPIGCANVLNFYLDADGDGWGEADSVGSPLCAPDVDHGLTASNNLDCDDTDPDITGQVGSLCPQDLDAGGTADFAGLRRGDSEYLVVFGASEPQRFSEAEARCQAWAGVPLDDAGGHRGLATLSTGPEAADVQQELLDGLGQSDFGAFVDLRWAGTLDTGAWEWSDGSAPDSLPACGGVEPTVADFFPALNAGDPNALPTLEEHLAGVRLVMVSSGGGWCRGAPSAASAPGYDAQSAHYLCERPVPVLSDYQDQPEGQGGSAVSE